MVTHDYMSLDQGVVTKLLRWWAFRGVCATYQPVVSIDLKYSLIYTINHFNAPKSCIGLTANIKAGSIPDISELITVIF